MNKSTPIAARNKFENFPLCNLLCPSGEKKKYLETAKTVETFNWEPW